MDLIVFGSLYLEVVFGDFDRLPRPGEELRADGMGLVVLVSGQCPLTRRFAVSYPSFSKWR